MEFPPCVLSRDVNFSLLFGAIRVGCHLKCLQGRPTETDAHMPTPAEMLLFRQVVLAIIHRSTSGVSEALDGAEPKPPMCSEAMRSRWLWEKATCGPGPAWLPRVLVGPILLPDSSWVQATEQLKSKRQKEHFPSISPPSGAAWGQHAPKGSKAMASFLFPPGRTAHCTRCCRWPAGSSLQAAPCPSQADFTTGSTGSSLRPPSSLLHTVSTFSMPGYCQWVKNKSAWEAASPAASTRHTCHVCN